MWLYIVGIFLYASATVLLAIAKWGYDEDEIMKYSCYYVYIVTETFLYLLICYLLVKIS